MIDLRKGLLVGVLAIAALGYFASEPKTPVVDVNEAAAESDVSEDDYEVHDNGAIEVKSKVEDNVLWYQDDLSEPVENVGMLYGRDILDAAGLEADETEESADHKGGPKKFYIINDNPLSASMSHSPNGIALNWYQYSDEPEAIELSQQSLKNAYKLARAMAGKEGADAVMYLSNGGKYRSKPVGGYPATGQCNNGTCFIHIDLEI